MRALWDSASDILLVSQNMPSEMGLVTFASPSEAWETQPPSLPPHRCPLMPSYACSLEAPTPHDNGRLMARSPTAGVATIVGEPKASAWVKGHPHAFEDGIPPP